MTVIKTLPPAPPGAAVPAKIQQAAEDFTAVALNEMLSPMFDTLDQSGGRFGGGAGEAAFRPLLINEFAKSIAQDGGFGLTSAVAAAMLRLQETPS
jgi:Rod binding domain-containing protein